MARQLKTLPAEMYVAEVTTTYRGYTNTFLIGPYATLETAKGQATASAWNGAREVTARFFKGTVTWGEQS